MKRSTARREKSGALPPYPKLGGTGVLDALRHAWNGLVHTVVHQRNMRLHMLAATLVGLVGSGIPLDLAEKVTLIFCVLLVFFAEILNSALEQIVDLAIQQFDEKARVAKDAAAAGVALLAAGTVVIFAALLVHNWDTIRQSGSAIFRQVLLGVPLTLCVGGLMMKARKPRWVDALLFGIGLGLLAGIALRTTSYVFSAVNLGLLAVAGAAAVERRKLPR